MKTSFEVFIDTVKNLASSQGFYSRIYDGLSTMSIKELNELKEMINYTYEFKDPVDVVMALEG